MRNFFKTFFASFLALIVFTLIGVFLLVRLASSSISNNKVVVQQRSVLVIDLGQQFNEQAKKDAFAFINDDKEKNVPGLYDIIRLLRIAKEDKKIEGVYLQLNASPNGFAASEEIRNALLDFKKSGKFIIAYGDIITQKTYAIANVADSIYVSPQGMVEWYGMSVNYLFLKGMLDKLEIEPQIFYAGKFKSATEPLRTDKMSEANKLQTTVWLNDLYNDLLVKTAAARNTDTANLRLLANEGRIRRAQDAVDNKLVDGLRYDDEVKDEIKKRLKIDKYERIEFVSINAYMSVAKYIKTKGEKIALIYANGEIIDGKGDNGNIGGDSYRSLLRRARLDQSVKAIVVRINSGGGSALASEVIWREMALAKKEKPVIVSFGDVAASGGYYMACAADSIFALPTTITGSIGVFGIVPNFEGFFKNKTGITFDGVKTGPYADLMSVTRPMTTQEKTIIQGEIEHIYNLFKTRVAEGRKKDTAFVENVAQGRVWTGMRAREIGLIDRFGGVEDAIQSAAGMAKLTDYYVQEYPEPENIFDQLLGKSAGPMNKQQLIEQEIGAENYQLYQQLKNIRQMMNRAQARVPFEFIIK